MKKDEDSESDSSFAGNDTSLTGNITSLSLYLSPYLAGCRIFAVRSSVAISLFKLCVSVVKKFLFLSVGCMSLFLFFLCL